MRLKAGSKLSIKAKKSAPFIAMLRPRSGDAQWIVHESCEIQPFVSGREFVDPFGNLCQRLSAPAASFTIRTEMVAEVSPEIAVDRKAGLTPAEHLPDSALQYLLPSRYCPSDKMVDQAKELAAKQRPGYAQVETIVRFIRETLEYRYGVSDASTSALETLEDKAGVCRDFAHVGISLCRALQIPARMVVGYLHGLEPMDQHAWFEAYLDNRWYTFDATQSGPKGGRIVIGYGRDATDVAIITELGDLKTESMDVWVEKQ